MIIDLLKTVLFFCGAVGIFGLSVFALLYLTVSTIRSKIEGKVVLVASLSGALPMLLAIPLVVEDNWNNHFYQLEEKLNRDGTCDIDADYVDSDGYSIGGWSVVRYREYIGGELNENRKKALEQSGFIKLCSVNPSFI